MKIINRPQNVVEEMCRGISLSEPGVEFLSRYRILKKKNIDQDKVSLISGGGSGHEPAHAGYIGKGMLDAAVCGDIFASPSQIQVYQACNAVKSKKGILLIIKNYSGDIMNFRNGAALAQAEGARIDYVKVEDDIAVQDSKYTVGRRGVAGTVLVHKCAGAAAEAGLSLEEVKAAAQHAADRVRSIGFAFSSCIVPATGVPTFEIQNGEMEYGVGIHGEPGRTREKALSADELAERMIRQLTEDLQLTEGEETAVLVNGFGGTPLQELYVLADSVFRVLHKKGIKVYRCFTGNYMTSIDMQGASVSLMKLDEELKKLLDAPCHAPAFRVDGPEDVPVLVETRTAAAEEASAEPLYDSKWEYMEEDQLTLENIFAMVSAMRDCILEKEAEFCKMDSYAGDGDFGMSVAKGFRQVKRQWNQILKENSDSIGEFLKACSYIIMEYCGGASGPIWGSAFHAAGIFAGDRKFLTKKEFSDMIMKAVEGIKKTGERSFGRGAEIGDKTLIDALEPCAAALAEQASRKGNWKGFLEAGAVAAKDGAEQTKNIVARMGRAGVVGERSLGYPDAGAYALGVIFREIAERMKDL